MEDLGDVTEESLESRGEAGEMGDSLARLEGASGGPGRLSGLNCGGSGAQGAEGAGLESALTGPADTLEATEQVVAVSLVQARGRGTLICLHLTELPFKA